MEINRPEHKSIKDMSLEELQGELKSAKREQKSLPRSLFWTKRVWEIQVEIEGRKNFK